MTLKPTLLRLIAFLVPVGLAAAVLAIGLQMRQSPQQKPPQERSQAVRVIEIEPRSFVPTVSGYGAAEPARTWNAVAQVAGRVEFVNPELRPGAILTAGTEIVRISPKDFQLAVEEAGANLRSAEARLAELRAQEENARSSLEIERRSLAINEKDLERKERLEDRGTVSQSVVDETQRSVLQQQARVQDLENSLRLFPAQIDAQQRQIEVNRAKLETARLNLERTVIALPFDARIASTSVERTQFVATGTTLATADGIATAEVTAQIPQDRFRTFLKLSLPEDFEVPEMRGGELSNVVRSLGWSAEVRLRSSSNTVTWDARLVRTSDTIDPRTRTVGAIVAVDRPYDNVRPIVRPPLVKGMFVEVVLKGPRQGGVIVIPRAAVHDGKVYVANDEDRLEIRPVEIRARQGEAAVVETGLAAGDRLVVSDLSPAIPGMLLRPSTIASGEPARGEGATALQSEGQPVAGREAGQ